MKLSRLTLIILSSLSAALAGCGDDNAIRHAVQTLRFAAFGTPDTEISRQRIATIPYAMITARAGKLPPAILVLGSDDGSRQQWFSTNKISLVTRAGRLIQTVGFDRDIREDRRFGQDPLGHNPHRLKTHVRFRRQITGWMAGRSISFLECEITPEDREHITIVELQFDTVRLREICRDESGDDFENVYWVDVFDGFVWKSRQWAGRGGPLIEVQVLIPPATAG